MQKKKTVKKISLLLLATMVLLIANSIALLKNSDKAEADSSSAKWEISLNIEDGDDLLSDVPLAEFDSYIDYGYFKISLYAKPLTSDNTLGALGFQLSVDSAIFDLAEFTSMDIETAEYVEIVRGQEIRTPIWDFNNPIMISDTNLAIMGNGKDGNSVQFTTNEPSKIADIYLTVKDDAVVSDSLLEAMFVNDGSGQYMVLANGNNVPYNTEEVKFVPFTIGEGADVQPNATLQTLSVLGQDDSGQVVEHIADFAPDKDIYNISVPYTVAQNIGLDLRAVPAKTSITSEDIQIAFMLGGNPYTDVVFEGGKVSGLADGMSIIITVNDTAGDEQKTYTINVEVKPQSSDADLIELGARNYASGSAVGQLSPALSSEVYDYVLTLPFESLHVKIYAMPKNYYAQVSFEGLAADLSLQIPPADIDFTKTIKVNVTAEDGTKNTYNLTIKRALAYSDTELDSVLVNGKVSQYSEDTKTYSYTIGENEENFNFRAIAKDASLQKLAYLRQESGAQYKTFISNALINGVDTGSAFLITQKNSQYIIKIKVTPQSGGEFGDPEQYSEYDLIVTRAASTNTELSDIRIREGSNEYGLFLDGVVANYTIKSKDSKTLRISATTKDANAAVKIMYNGADISTGGAGTATAYDFDVSSFLPDTDYEIKVIVTAQDTETVGEYHFKIIKLSSDSTLKLVELRDENSPYQPFNNFLQPDTYYSYNLPNQYEFESNFYTIIKVKLTVETNSRAIKSVTSTDGITLSQTGSGIYTGSLTFDRYAYASLTVRFTVTAQDGSTQSYSVNIERAAADTNALLSSLKVGENEILPSFNGQLTRQQSYIVDRNLGSVSVSADAESVLAGVVIQYKTAGSDWSLPGTGQLQVILSPGIANSVTMRITVTPQSGSNNANEYTFTIVAADEDNSIKSIVLETSGFDYSALFNFQKTVYEYEFSVTYSVASLKILASPNSGQATIIGASVSGTVFNLTAGDTTTFTIYARSEAGVDAKDKYIIKIFREQAKTDTTLSNLSVNFGGTESGFWALPSDTVQYRVDHSIDSVSIDASTLSGQNSSIISGLGTVSLVSGRNSFNIVVRAESGITKTYTLYVYRANDNADITNITNNGDGLGYYSDKYSYTLQNVSYSTQKLILKVTLADRYASLHYNVNGTEYTASGGGTLTERTLDINLTAGANIIKVYAKPQYEQGEQSAVYEISIMRSLPSTDARLKSLQVIDGKGTNLIENPMDIEDNYYLRVDTSVTKLNAIIAEANSATATVIVPEALTLVQNNIRVFTITVLAEDGKTTRTYSIEVVCASNDDTISSIKANGTAVSFDEDFKATLQNVPFATKQINIEALLPAGSTAKVYGGGTLTLAVGENEFIIYAVSKYDEIKGTENTGNKYKITIVRNAADTDAKLKSLQVVDGKGTNLIENPMDIEDNYYLRVDTSVTKLNAIIAEANSATATVIVPEALALLQNNIRVFTVTVLAEDGKTTRTYSIEVVCASNDDTISSIKANGTAVNFDEDFKATLQNVPFATKQINIEALLPAGSTAKVYGSGTLTLAVGENEFIIYAVSKYDEIKGTGNTGNKYKIIIVRNAADTDARLKSLQVIDGKGTNLIENPTDIEDNYYLRVDTSVTKLNAIIAEANSATATVIVPEALTLVQNNIRVFTITVLAEDGKTTKTYSIEVVCASNDDTISSIKANGNAVNFDEDFKATLQNVPFATKQINIEALLPAGSTAKVYGGGTLTLAVGENEFIIYAVSKYDEIKGTENTGNKYKITIVRNAADTDANLSALYAELPDDSGTRLPFDKAFAPGTFIYNLVLDKDYAFDTFKILAEAKSATAIVTGDANIEISLIKLANGSVNQTHKITVTAEDGVTKNTYTIIITKPSSLSSENSILSVSLQDSEGNSHGFSFDVGVKSYTVELPFNIEGMQLSVTASPKSVVSGAGFLNVDQGKTRTFTFFVTAEDGTKGEEYTIVVTRKAARDFKTLNSLNVSYGGNDYNIALQNNVFSYSYRVDRGTEGITLSAGVALLDGSVIFEGTTAYGTSYSKYIMLTSGQVTEIILKVQAENNSSEIYTIKLICKNNDTELKEVTITGIGINYTAQFDAEFTYSMPAVAYHVKTVNVSVVASDTNASISGSYGTIVLGDNAVVVKFRIIAEDGTLGQQYTLVLNRLPSSSDNKLSVLKVLDNTDDLLVGNNKFSSEKILYEFYVTRAVTAVTLQMQANHAGAIVSGSAGTRELTPGAVNTFVIIVTAEDNSQREYTIKITVKDDDNKITGIVVAGDSALLQFDADINEYTVDKVFDRNIADINISVTINSLYASIYGSGKVALKEGTHTYEVYAVSERGDRAESYFITITKEQSDSNNYLSTLNITDTNDNILPLLETFNKLVTDYTLILPASFTGTALIAIASAEKETATVSGTGVQVLKVVGDTVTCIIEVKVTAQNGDVRTYKILVVKASNGGGGELSDDCAIRQVSLTYSGSDNLLSGFDASVAVQLAVTIPYSAQFVEFKLTAHSQAVKYGEGVYNIASGKTITITFYVKAQDGTTGMEYSVSVTRTAASEDNSITEFGYMLNGEAFLLDESLASQTIYIDDAFDRISFFAQYPGSATAEGLDTEIVLGDGSSAHIITVIAESGKVKNYIINIVRQSTDARLNSILLDGQEIIAEFAGGEYNITLPYSKANVVVLATATCDKAMVIGNGTYAAAPGTVTKIYVYAKAEAGNEGTQYVLNVTRLAADTNSTLKSLVVKDNLSKQVLPISPNFAKNIYSYLVDLSSLAFTDINELFIEAQADSNLAIRVTGTGVRALQTGDGKTSETFVITVTAEDGSTSDYTVVVTREIKPEEDVLINFLSVTGGNGIEYLGMSHLAENLFEVSVYNYVLIVPYTVSNVTFTVTNDNKAKLVMLKGMSNMSLSIGDANEIVFYLNSQNGKVDSPQYTIQIVREQPSDNNLLSNIKVGGDNMPNFNPAQTAYSLPAMALPIIDGIEAQAAFIEIFATAQDSTATIGGSIGRMELKPGINTFTITVYAQNGDRKEYTVSVELLSADSRVYNIFVAGYNAFDDDLVFDENTESYTLTVPYSVNKAEIIAVVHPNAAAKGVGYISLNEGGNTINVYAVSQIGTTGTVYTLNIKREYVSRDASLKSLKISSGSTVLDINPSFSADTYEYNIFLYDTDGTSAINNVFIEAAANSQFALVEGTGYRLLMAKELPDGSSQYFHNVLEVNVRAQDGTIATYIINIFREVQLDDDVTLGKVSLTGSDGVIYLGTQNAQIPFKSDIYSYTISVPHNVYSVTLDVSALSPLAMVWGAGTRSFSGTYTVTFSMYIVSASGKEESDRYNITVVRDVPVSDNTLKSITVNGEPVDIQPDVTLYKLSVPFNAMPNVIISAAPKDSTASVTGTGSFKLEHGENIYTLIVQAQDGSTRSYTVIISYLNSDARLKFLNIEGFKSEDGIAVPYSIVFNPDISEYSVLVDSDIMYVNFNPVTFSDKAAVRGLVRYTLTSQPTTAMLTVVASDNTTTKTYTITISKAKPAELCNDKTLAALEVVGYTQFVCQPALTTYYLTVRKDTDKIDVRALASSDKAKVSVTGYEYIEPGKNLVIVKVDAEDGSFIEYKIIVTRAAEGDTMLTVLLIASFVLWLITVVVMIIKSQNNKNNRNNTGNGKKYTASAPGGKRVYFYLDEDDQS